MNTLLNRTSKRAAPPTSFARFDRQGPDRGTPRHPDRAGDDERQIDTAFRLVFRVLFAVIALIFVLAVSQSATPTPIDGASDGQSEYAVPII